MPGPATQPALIRALYLILVAAAVPPLIWNGFVEQGSTQWNDLLLRMRGAVSSPAVSSIMLAAIDDRTVGQHGPLPLERRKLASGLRALAAAAPHVLVLDLLIAEPGDPEADAALAAAVRLFPRAVVGAALEGDPGQEGRWILPLPTLTPPARIGHVHAAPDPDGNARSVLLAKAGQGHRFWALGLETALLALGAERPVETRQEIRLGGIQIPARESDSFRMLIHYAGPEGVFPRVSFGALLDGAARPEVFRDKIVIVGVTAQGGGDRLFTPVSAGLGMSGIEIHANVVRTILDAAFLVPLGVAAELGVSFLIVALCAATAARLRGIRLFAALLGIGGAILLGSAAALRMGQVWPCGSFVAVFLVAAAVAGASEYGLVSRALAHAERRRKEYAFRVQAIAHEIKTPLTAIQGSSEMIAEQWVGDQQRVEMAGLIHKESKRLTGLLQTFLNVERLASGALALEKREVELAGLCREVVERGRLYAARKRIQVDAEIPELRLAADPELLSFAIYNLITNGVKYSPKDTRVVVSVAADGDGVRLAVADQGYGITPAEQAKIFEKFYRLKRDETGAEEGTGIGLALVKEIVEQHGGTITVESRPGGGSRFTIWLPNRLS